MENMKIWDAVKQPPKEALKQIGGGRLKGMTDVNPQWRYQAATEQFGPCGIGWKYEIKRLWLEPGPDNQIFAFAEIDFSYKTEDGMWSDAIPGIGGSMLVPKESSGLHANDEGYKMAVTDALSVAMKMLGFGADIYAGRWDGSKYKEAPQSQKVISRPSSSSTEDKTEEAEVLDELKRCFTNLGWGAQQIDNFKDSFPEIKGKAKLTLEEKRFLLAELKKDIEGRRND